jgi:polyhydroxyalkanoate synthesis regulator phasin
MTNPERKTAMKTSMKTSTETDPSTPTNPGTAATRGSRRRRGTILGVGAGVLGGGLVGLAMTVPTFTNAASEDSSDTVVSALQDTDTSADDTSTDDTSTDDTDRPDRGARLRATLQVLVDDGTLTAEQADAVAEHLAAQLPERGDRRGGHRGHPGMDGEVVAELLGIDAAELRSSLRDGQSIADLAEANGIDVQTVIDALVAEAESHLDLAVENGRLTEDEAAEKLVDVTERITARVNGERPARG